MGIPNSLLPIPKGTTIRLDDILFYEGENVIHDQVDGDDHYIMQLAKPYGDSPAIRWFGWAKHLQVDEGSHPDPQDEPITLSVAKKAAVAKAVGSMLPSEVADPKADEDLGPLVSIPGHTNKVRLFAPIYWESGKPCNFTWAEATKGGNPRRMPTTMKEVRGIIQGAKRVQRCRDILGVPLRVNSWLRPKSENRRVGGSSKSFHIKGCAVDWVPIGKDLVEAFYEIKKDKIVSRGGLAVGNGFIHTDTGPSRRWHYRNGPKVTLW